MISILINLMAHFFLLCFFDYIINVRDKNDKKQWFLQTSWVTDQTFKKIPKTNAGLLFPSPFVLLIIQ